MREVTWEGLSDEQRAIVDCTDRAIVVLASAGSGKTEVVAQRVERLLTESDADFRVLALSYTRRAAAELRARFALRLGGAGRRVETDTVHGFAQSLLLQYGTWIGVPPDPAIVVDDIDRVDLLQAWRAGQGLPPLPDARRRLLELDLVRARREDDTLLDEWSTALADAGALDYEAMLARASELLEVLAVRRLVGRLYRHVIVDEAQNLTASQYALIASLVGVAEGEERSHAVFVGDDKQSIVGFAGASAEHMSTFVERSHARVFHLTRNFRSAKAIVDLGATVASALGNHPPTPQTYAAQGAVICQAHADEGAEAAAVTDWVRGLLRSGLPGDALSPGESSAVRDRDIGILARSAASLRACATALERVGVAVAQATHADDWLMSDLGRQVWLIGTFRAESDVSRRRVARALGVERVESVDDVRDHLREPHADALRALVGLDRPQAFVTAVERLSFDDVGWFEDQQELREAWARFCDHQAAVDRGWPQFELFIARWQRGDDDQPGVRLQTVHKSQGREFTAVAVVGLNEGQFPDFRANSPHERQEELRAFYVAVTRPSRLLLLTRPRSTMSRSGAWRREASSFLRLVLPVGQERALPKGIQVLPNTRTP